MKPVDGAAAASPELLIRRDGTGDGERPELTVRLVRLGGPEDEASFEAEPNDSPRDANLLIIGHTVEGSADDVDYLDNQEEGRKGLDWFRFEVPFDEPSLVFFELDVLDRDVSMNLRVYAPDPAGKDQVVPYLEGKDPMEIVHDRERERYSKAITRVFKKGTYYLEVNANHPRYILRSYRYPVPPYEDPSVAVEVGARYIMDVGDAWFAQVPREGNIYRRVQNMHETALRCTACHPAVFSTEANLVAHRNGYPIPSKSNFRYVVERIYNSIAPFYGPDGLWWQRFIAIPLQAQGKQGGILMDFEKEVSGRETDVFLRFGPLLRSAWSQRDALPADEQNGVVPADSKFGFAWRDWRVLTECYRRTGDGSYARAAGRLREIFTSPQAATRIETLQDRIHLVLGLTYMGKEEYGARIAAEIERLLALERPDGGWNEEGKTDRPSAEYTTGQILYTLIEAGLRRENEPRLEKALRWLLGRQMPFGGWFQTDTHENFRTPMRETRYAVMALSSAFPRPGAPLRGMGNIGGVLAKLPEASSPASKLLEGLESLWEAPDRCAEIGARAMQLLERPEAPIRAAAAALLGRIGGAECAGPLLERLSDPSKLVWRSAAWALRQLGNRGQAANSLKEALQSQNPLVRRGAARAFAYQFQGMDTRLDIARVFLELAPDPDLITRLQAIRTLRQWWYRTSDPELRSLVVKTFLERMGVESSKMVRKNLSENMYILLDENQSGGVSMQRNLRDLPKEVAERVLEGRKEVEKNILLDPLLVALRGGNELQREAILESFDGSMFKGRTYARVPRDMIDVGNDREFSFLYTPDESLLERTIGVLVASATNPHLRQRSIELASFFEMPRVSQSEGLQTAFLDATFSDNPGLRAVALDAVRRDLVLHPGSSGRVAARIGAILREGSAEARSAVLVSLGRSPAVLGDKQLREALALLLDHELSAGQKSADFLPLVGSGLLDDDRALEVLESAWKALRGHPAAEKIPVVEALMLGKFGSAPGARGALRILEEASTDPQVAVREKVFDLLGSEASRSLRKSPRAATILYAGLSDESPAIRARSLGFARENDALWKEEDVHEYVLKLLVDADRKIRQAALETVAERHLIVSEPRYAARVKAVADGDEALRSRATDVLKAAKIDPARVKADAEVAVARLPDLLLFRDQVNPYFYKKGEDGNACADCHATHTILGLAEPPKDGRALTDADVLGNYRSILKVINTGEPEQSLVLRKPRSPFGTGQSSDESPTGITHVGGQRWRDGTSGEMYQAILAFVRSARAAGPQVKLAASADSYSPQYSPALSVDGNPDTLWHTEFVGAMPGFPHELILELDAPRVVAGLTYVPRKGSTNGQVKEFEVYLSADGKLWGPAAAKGTWPSDPLPKTVFLPRRPARFVKLRGLSEVNGNPYMSAAEVEVIVSQGKREEREF